MKRPRQTHMSIGPSDRSEEACPSMMINRRQAGNNTREKAAKVPSHFAQEPWTPRNKQPDAATAGTNMDLHTRDTMLLGTSKSIYLTQESFILPCIISYYPFHLPIGAFVQIKVQIQKH